MGILPMRCLSLKPDVCATRSRLNRVILVLGLRRADLFLNALDVPATEGLYLASKLEVSADILICEDTEAVDHGNGASGPLHHVVRFQLQIGRVPYRKDHGLYAFESRWQISLHSNIHKVLLIAKEPGPRVARGGVGILALQFVPMNDIGIVHRYFCAHLGKLAQNQLAATVTRIPDILAVACTREEDPCTGNIPAHVAQRVARELRNVQSARVIDIDSSGAHLEDAITVLKA